jgi:hypothetical protein
VPKPEPAPPRRFIPPAVQTSERLLIQPDSPPDLKSPDIVLPALEVWIDNRLPKIPKPFRAPGHAAAPVPEATPTIISDAGIATPNSGSTMPVGLSLPVASAGASGDPLRIVSWSKNPAPPSDRIVISGGNESPQPAGPGGGTGTGLTAGDRPGSSGPGPGAGRPTAGPNPTIITRSRTGTFDAVIVQSTPLEQFPEAKNLLPGRPIYTVYISLGAEKDCAFYFSVPEPESHRAAAETRTVMLGNPSPVSAPFPFRLVRPAIGFPAGRKYVLVHGFIGENGQFRELSLVAAGQPEWDQALLSSLEGWEFRPATRDRSPIAVEFLLSIPNHGM